jgi:NodT family efflux transporter outer membrane factor (OMF) lipoprotein
MKKILIIIFSIFLLGGCVTTNKTEIPVLSLPDGVQGESVHTGRWWEAFNDSELDALMQEAFRENLDITQAIERVKQGRALARAAGAISKPNVALNGSLGKVRQSSSYGALETDYYSAGVAASYELDVWGRADAVSGAALSDSLLTEDVGSALFMSITAELAEMYYTAIWQRQLRGIAVSGIEVSKKTEELITLRYSKGLVASAELYKARQTTATSRAQLASYDIAIVAASDAMAVMLGKIPGTLEAKGGDVLSAPPEFPEVIPFDLLLRRPDVLAAYKKIESADKRAAAAVAARMPSLNLAASYGGSGDTPSSILEADNIVWSIMLNAALSVFDGGRKSAEAEAARAAVSEAVAAYKKAVLMALQDVNIAIVRSGAKAESLSALSFATQAADDGLKVAKQKYQLGLGDYLAVLVAQSTAHSASASYTTALHGLVSSRIQLARALGGTWMSEELREMISYSKDEEQK